MELSVCDGACRKRRHRIRSRIGRRNCLQVHWYVCCYGSRGDFSVDRRRRSWISIYADAQCCRACCFPGSSAGAVVAPMVLSPATYWTAEETTSGNYGVGPGIYGVILVYDMLDFHSMYLYDSAIRTLQIMWLAEPATEDFLFRPRFPWTSSTSRR